MSFEPSTLIAYVRENNGKFDEGPVLEATGDFLRELNDSSWEIGDLNIPSPTGPGLWVFEGWIEFHNGLDPNGLDPTEVSFDGSWERLSHWELCRMRHGMKARPSEVEP